MADLLNLLTRMRSAFEIFDQELDTHLATFRSISDALEQEDPTTVFTEQAKTLEQRFHVIKGGSGFLQLKAIAELATLGEGWFKGAKLPEEPRPEELSRQFQTLVDRLSEERKELRQLLRSTEETA